MRRIEAIRHAATSMPDGNYRTSVLSLVHTGDTLVLSGSNETLDETITSVIRLFGGRLRRMQCTELKNSSNIILSELRPFGNLLELRYNRVAPSPCRDAWI